MPIPSWISGCQVIPRKMQSIKCVIVGDRMVGKSCLINTYLDGAFYTESYRTIFDIYPITVKVDNNLVTVDFWDTSGADQYNDYRFGIYPQTDVFLVCFSLVDDSSLRHVKKQWNHEVRHYCPDAPKILVGTQLDLRRDNDLAVSYEKGLSVAKKVGAVKYIECSALKGAGLDDLFVEAVKTALIGRQRNNSMRCTFF